MKIYRASIQEKKVTTDTAEYLTERSVIFDNGYKIPIREKDRYEYFATFEGARSFLFKYFEREEKKARERVDLMRSAKMAVKNMEE